MLPIWAAVNFECQISGFIRFFFGLGGLINLRKKLDLSNKTIREEAICNKIWRHGYRWTIPSAPLMIFDQQTKNNDYKNQENTKDMKEVQLAFL